MASKKANKRKTVNTRTTRSSSKKASKSDSHSHAFRNTILIITATILTILIAIGVFFVLKYYFYDNKLDVDGSNGVIEPTSEPEKKEAVILPDRIDFQPVVDSWANTINGNRSVLIYDLERDEVVGEYNSTESYNTASLYKLFVVYEGYRRLQSGTWSGNEKAGYTGYTISECLDLAIRESNSVCAEALLDRIGRKNLEDIIENDFSITESDILDYVSNPRDIMKMMKIFYEHEDITDENLIATMKDSFLNQPKTVYDWRQGLPSGFRKSTVYNKVGWDFNPDTMTWNIYHDAAIVETPDGSRHFIVVVMTNQVPYQNITRLGSMIEEKF